MEEQLYFYKHENPAIEMDFFVRDANSLVPVEVKAKDSATASLNNLIKWDSYPDVKYGIKLGYKNIGEDELRQNADGTNVQQGMRWTKVD